MLGIDFHADGKTAPETKRLRALGRFTEEFVNRFSWDVKELQRVLGLWTWVFVQRWPLLSVFQQFDRPEASNPKIVKSTWAAPEELCTVVAILPLIDLTPSMPF